MAAGRSSDVGAALSLTGSDRDIKNQVQDLFCQSHLFGNLLSIESKGLVNAEAAEPSPMGDRYRVLVLRGNFIYGSRPGQEFGAFLIKEKDAQWRIEDLVFIDHIDDKGLITGRSLRQGP